MIAAARRTEPPLAMTLDGVPAFRPRAPWWGGDLQTVRNYLVMRRLGIGLPAVAGERLYLPMRDGSGDRLQASLTQAPKGRPLIVLIHGLTGSEDSTYMLVSARHFHRLGCPVLRFNLRGAGPSRTTCRGHTHAGRSDDLRDALKALDPALIAGGLCLIGYSLGGNILLKFLAEHAAAFPIGAAATVSAPIDLAATARRFLRPRNVIYQRWLLAKMKENALAGALDPAERRAVEAAPTVYAFDDGFVAPHHGFATADRYYAECAALKFMDAIRTPTLMIHALDDPWIPADAYLDHDWRATPRLSPAILRHGGHCGFHHSRGGSWHDRAIAHFFGLQ
ncbi:MAG: YheT family hydrolase [Kiloniellales bacterium]